MTNLKKLVIKIKTNNTMLQSITKLIVMVLLVTAFTSCNQGPTLQTYYVDNELKPGFMSFDAPTSLISLLFLVTLKIKDLLLLEYLVII